LPKNAFRCLKICSSRRWNEKAGPRRDAISSQYALEVQKETGHEEEYHPS
jgi:hypothetical protein